jgi:CHAD domain-containing protein
MSVHANVAVWAVALLRERVESFESVRRKAAQDWKRGKRLHDVRTNARRLRAWVEDLQDCVAAPQELLDVCKSLSDETNAARDAQVMLERLERYRRFAMPAERAEIDDLCASLRKQRRTGMKAAKRAVKGCTVELRP